MGDRHSCAMHDTTVLPKDHKFLLVQTHIFVYSQRRNILLGHVRYLQVSAAESTGFRNDCDSQFIYNIPFQDYILHKSVCKAQHRTQHRPLARKVLAIWQDLTQNPLIKYNRILTKHLLVCNCCKFLIINGSPYFSSVSLCRYTANDNNNYSWQNTQYNLIQQFDTMKHLCWKYHLSWHISNHGKGSRYGNMVGKKVHFHELPIRTGKAIHSCI